MYFSLHGVVVTDRILSGTFSVYPVACAMAAFPDILSIRMVVSMKRRIPWSVTQLQRPPISLYIKDCESSRFQPTDFLELNL